MSAPVATRRIELPTGVTLAVAEAGAGEPIIFLHGFPESHRTWRHQLAALAGAYRVIAPDGRGFAASDKPEGVEAYRTDRIVEDLFALADAAGIDRFTLVGHDWGGAASWLAALRRPERLKRLVIVNAPHPLIFQRSLFDSEAQRSASQYIRAFRTPGMEAAIEAMGLETFFEKSFGAHVDLNAIPPEERAAYLHDWAQPGALTAMLNWYRASDIEVPAPTKEATPPAWLTAPFPRIAVPTLVIWGMKDKALLPLQLDGLEELVDDLQIERVEDAGHFVPWERPEAVTDAIRRFIEEA